MSIRKFAKIIASIVLVMLVGIGGYFFAATYYWPSSRIPVITKHISSN